MRFACWINKATHTLRIRNTYCFSTATMVTLYIHCVSCDVWRYCTIFLSFEPPSHSPPNFGRHRCLAILFRAGHRADTKVKVILNSNQRGATENWHSVISYNQAWCSSSPEGKAVRLQAWTGPQGWAGSRISRQSAHEGGKVVSPTHRPPFAPREDSWYSFLLEAESTTGPQCDRKD